MSFRYFDTEHAISTHDEIIRTTGGSFGILNAGLLTSTLEHIQNDFYYEKLEDKLTHLFFSINKNHCFADGNKRASILLSAYFLEINNCEIIVKRFIRDMENIAVDVADNRIDKDLLFEIIYSFIYESEFSEALKLKIIQAKKPQIQLL